ncbi:MAG: rfaE bifunctional protein kinase chain/domain [Verrucomicrobiales bacterium]|jgi:rfaE bifunctional protein kinase chain/domain
MDLRFSKSAMTRDRFEQLLTSFPEKRILTIGDVMLDRFVWGSVSRISPEAPVPVVHVKKESVYPGGAANVARNLVPFTEKVDLVGLIGEDEFGRQLAETLKQGGIHGSGIVRDPDFETIVKTRIIARQQQVCRVDRENPRPPTQAQQDEIRDFVRSNADSIDAIILEDYGKGLLQQHLLDEIVEIAREKSVVVAADPNPENKLKWNGVTVLKPNRLEAFRMAGIPEPTPNDDPMQDEALREVGQQLLNRWDIEMLLITLGEHGMILFERGKANEPQHVPVRAQEVFDVSGAGDTAIALLTLTLISNASPIEAIEVANYASGAVVGKLGTATLTPEELREAIPAS